MEGLVSLVFRLFLSFLVYFIKLSFGGSGGGGIRINTGFLDRSTTILQQVLQQEPFNKTKEIETCIIPTYAVLKIKKGGKPNGNTINTQNAQKLKFNGDKIINLGRRMKKKVKKIVFGKKLYQEICINNTALIEQNIKPILVFVNRKSGGRLGRALISSFLSLLHNVQVCDLSKYRPSDYLTVYKNTSNVKVLCCGGDGTVNWILNDLISVGMAKIPVGIIPLGTGNDLYNYLYNNHMFLRSNEAIQHPADVILKYHSSTTRSVDRWTLTFPSSSSSSSSTTSTSATNIITNKKNKISSLSSSPSLHTKISNRIKYFISKSLMQNNTIIPLLNTTLTITPVNNTTETLTKEPEEETLTKQSSKVILKKVYPFINKLFTKIITYQSKRKHQKYHQKSKSMINYYGIGVDGEISMTFYKLRQQFPYLFISRTINKLWYGIVALISLFRGGHVDLSQYVSMYCDGHPVVIPQGTRGIIVLNINSYAGGSRLWQAGGTPKKLLDSKSSTSNSNSSTGSSKILSREKWRHLSCDDSAFEVVAVRGIAHLGSIKAGLSSAIPLAQGSRLVICTQKKLSMQVDGEPWKQRKGKIELNWGNSIKVLVPEMLSKK